jgi:membrane-bound ClpP family serine protease
MAYCLVSYFYLPFFILILGAILYLSNCTVLGEIIVLLGLFIFIIGVILILKRKPYSALNKKNCRVIGS